MVSRREIEDWDQEWADREAQDVRLRADGYTDDEIDELDAMGLIDDFGNVTTD